jgi:hypothetical protein
MCQTTATMCSNPVLTTYPDNTCTNGIVINPASGLNNCASFTGDDHAHTYFTYSAMPDTVACAATGSVPVNGAVQGTPTTICCP